MSALIRRAAVALPMSALLSFTFASVVLADATGKTITTTAGVCGPEDGDPDCSADVLYPVTGQIFFSADQVGEDHEIVDYLCVHEPGTGAFTSYSMGGTYHLTLTGGLVGSYSYTVNGGQDCTGQHDYSSGAIPSLELTSSTVTYTLTFDSFDPSDFGAFNSVRNHVIDRVTGHGVDSPSAGEQPNPVIPEAPLVILLVATAGIGTVWFVSRRMRAPQTFA
jgi:hypothetical protein